MYCVKNVTEDLIYVGGSDRRLALFENVYPIPRGVSYNSYLCLDEKTVLLDTVDHSVSGLFFENVEHALGGRKLDYLIINHMEPDHCREIPGIVARWPEVKLVCNKKTLTMLGQFFDFDAESRAVIVGEGDTLCTGRHTFAFVMAPMVHWPEAMVTYDTTDRILFSADAFGTFGALSGNIFADEVNFESEWLPDARRYYTNIVGKYDKQVQTLLRKASGLDIAMICPLHGPIWRKDIAWFIDKYVHWSTYKPEENAVMIAYASIYGGTENAASILANYLADMGVRNIAMYDVSSTDSSYIVSEAFRCSHLVFASATYNAGMFLKMETVINDIVAHNLQNRKIALIENGTWAPAAGELMNCCLSRLKNMEIMNAPLLIKSAVKPSSDEQLKALACAIADSMGLTAPAACASEPAPEAEVDPNAMFKLSYGLFVLSGRDGERDNGCIINTVMQVTDTPKRIAIAVNKANLTHDMVKKTGMFNISVLSQDAPFDLFKRFGFQSGRDADKFAGLDGVARSANGLDYLTHATNALISGKVIATQDLGTHTLFVADVTEARILSSVPSVTYSYYFDHIKPKPQPALSEQKGWVCKICGYVYEGEVLPADFICPLCKHGVEDFERLG